MTRLPHEPPFSGGPDVARLCLGTMMFGDCSDASEAARIVDLYLERGGNFIHTADVYAQGGYKKVLGGLLRARREDIVLATKAGTPLNNVPATRAGRLSDGQALRSRSGGFPEKGQDRCRNKGFPLCPQECLISGQLGLDMWAVSVMVGGNC